MEKCLFYKIKNKEYLEARGEGLSEFIKGRLNSKGFDVLVEDLIIEDFANIIVDYSFDINTNVENLKKLTEQIFNRFNIEFELDKNIEV